MKPRQNFHIFHKIGQNVELEEVKIKENVIVVGELKFTLPQRWCFDSCITGEPMIYSHNLFVKFFKQE